MAETSISADQILYGQLSRHPLAAHLSRDFTEDELISLIPYYHAEQIETGGGLTWSGSCGQWYALADQLPDDWKQYSRGRLSVAEPGIKMAQILLQGLGEHAGDLRLQEAALFSGPEEAPGVLFVTSRGDKKIETGYHQLHDGIVRKQAIEKLTGNVGQWHWLDVKLPALGPSFEGLVYVYGSATIIGLIEK